jgi:hypothetical protein
MKRNQFSDVTFEERLESALKNCITTKTCCLEWQGAKAGRGLYPVIRDRNSKPVRVSRVMLERSGIKRPTDKHVACHKCDNPNCVEPTHLFWGTVQENAIDMVNKNRQGIITPEHRQKMNEANRKRMLDPVHRAYIMKDLVRNENGRWQRKGETNDRT